jgi:CRP-like cAMP-binding protein
MTDFAELLNADPVFGAADASELSLLFADAAEEQFAAGHVLVEAGAVVERAMFLAQGLVRTSWSMSAHRSLLRGLMSAPGLIETGSLSALASSPCMVAALTDITVVSVPVAQLQQWLRTHRHVAERLIMQSAATECLFVQRLRDQQRMLGERIDDLLRSYLEAYGAAGHPLSVELPLTNDVIASDLGVVARSVSSVLSSLQQRGVLRRTLRGLVIASPDALPAQGSFFLAPGRVVPSVGEQVKTERRGSLTVMGADIASTYDLPDEVRIGRAPECRVRLEDIASRHCRVFRATTSDRFWIEALKSGDVYLNDRLISRAVLNDGDVIRVGAHKIVFHETQTTRSSTRIEAASSSRDAHL